LLIRSDEAAPGIRKIAKRTKKLTISSYTDWAMPGLFWRQGPVRQENVPPLCRKTGLSRVPGFFVDRVKLGCALTAKSEVKRWRKPVCKKIFREKVSRQQSGATAISAIDDRMVLCKRCV
jgi:hypothetical protein